MVYIDLNTAKPSALYGLVFGFSQVTEQRTLLATCNEWLFFGMVNNTEQPMRILTMSENTIGFLALTVGLTVAAIPWAIGITFAMWVMS